MNGKIVLGLAATVVTVGSALAFRAHSLTNKAVGKTALNVKCLQCASLWSKTGGNHVTKCNTKAGGGGRTLHGIGSAAHSHTWATKVTTGGGCGSNTRTLVTTAN
jgi:hypothetical protein